jgi:hypothetical protein
MRISFLHLRKKAGIQIRIDVKIREMDLTGFLLVNFVQVHLPKLD